MLSPANRLPRLIKAALCALLPTMGKVGLVRLFSGSPARRELLPGMTPEQADYFHFISNLPTSFVTAGNEGCNWEKSASEARLAGNLGDRPLIVLTAGRAFVPDNPIDAKEAADFHQVWVNHLQPQLARLSSRGQQVIVENSGHRIAADAVLAAIREVATEIRTQRENQGH